jgi:tetrahydromethanopterin S-methyltransferase subunit B
MIYVTNSQREPVHFDDDEVSLEVIELQMAVIQIREMVSILEAIAGDVLASLTPTDGLLSSL